MKKIIMLLCVLCVSVCAFSEITYKTGQNLGTPIIYMIPNGIHNIIFGDHEHPLVQISAIYKYKDSFFGKKESDIWCVEMTYPQLSNSSAVGTYPVVYRYFYKVGDTITLNKYLYSSQYIDKQIKYTIKDLGWNYITLEPIENTPIDDEDDIDDDE